MPNVRGELTDDEVFGGAAVPVELSDEEVFGSAAPAPQPVGLGERFGAVLNQVVQSNPLAAVDRTIHRGLGYAARPFLGEGNILERGADRAVQERRDAEAAYEAVPSFLDEPTLGGKVAAGATSLAATLLGSAVDPTNLIAPGRTAVSKIAGAAGVNAATDAIGQGLDVATGGQDAYSPVQTAFSALAGAGLEGTQQIWKALRARAAARKGIAPDAATEADVTEAFEAGDPEIMAILRSAGATDEQIGAMEPATREAFAGRVQARRAEDAYRSNQPLDNAEGQSPAAISAEIDRRNRIREAIEAGEMDPGAAPTMGLQPRQAEAPYLVDSEGRAVRQDDTAARRGLELRRGGSSTALVPLEPQARPMSDEEVRQAQRASAAGSRGTPQADEPGVAAPDSGRYVAPEGRAPQTADQAADQRRADEAFFMVGRQRERAAPGIRDVSPAARPEGGVESQRPVYLDEGHPVDIIDRSFVQGPNGEMVEVAKVRRYDPRTGDPEPDGVEYQVPVKSLRSKLYGATPELTEAGQTVRLSQDFEDRAQSPVVGDGKAKGRRADEVFGRDAAGFPTEGAMARQTYRVTSEDPNAKFPGAGDGRTPIPPQTDRPYSPRWSSAEEAMRDFEARRAERERAYNEAREQAARENRDPPPRDEPEADASFKAKSSNAPKGQDESGRWHVSETGFVLSDKGGPIIFGDQKQAARWIIGQGQKLSPDQSFEIENHPTKPGAFTVRERNLSSRRQQSQAGREQPQPEQPGREQPRQEPPPGGPLATARQPMNARGANEAANADRRPWFAKEPADRPEPTPEPAPQAGPTRQTMAGIEFEDLGNGTLIGEVPGSRELFGMSQRLRLYPTNTGKGTVYHGSIEGQSLGTFQSAKHLEVELPEAIRRWKSDIEERRARDAAAEAERAKLQRARDEAMKPKPAPAAAPETGDILRSRVLPASTIERVAPSKLLKRFDNDLVRNSDYAGTGHVLIRRGKVDEFDRAADRLAVKGRTRAVATEGIDGILRQEIVEPGTSPVRWRAAVNHAGEGIRPEYAMGVTDDGRQIAVAADLLGFIRGAGLELRLSKRSDTVFGIYRDGELVGMAAPYRDKGEGAPTLKIADELDLPDLEPVQVKPRKATKPKAKGEQTAEPPQGTALKAEDFGYTGPTDLGPPGPPKGNKPLTEKDYAVVDQDALHERRRRREIDPTYSPAQKRAANDAKDRAVRQFQAAEDAAYDHQRDWGPWSDAREKAIADYANNSLSAAASFRAATTAPDRPMDTDAWRAGKAWVDANPEPKPSDRTIRVETRTARGHKTTYDLKDDKAAIEGVKKRISSLNATTFYSNPIGPAGRMLADMVKWLADKSGVTAGIKDLAGHLKATADAMRSHDGPGAVRSFLSAARRSHAGHARWLASHYKSPTAQKILDLLDAEPGKAGVEKVFHEAVEQRANPRQNEWQRIARAARETGVSDHDLVDMLLGIKPMNAKAAPVVKAMSDFFKAERDYATAAGVEMGKQKRYFPRLFDEASVRKNRADFLAKVAKIYRDEHGLSTDASKEAAENLFDAVIYGDVPSPFSKASSGTSSAIFKGREFSDKADRVLRDFYVRDLDMMGHSYVSNITRRAEIARRFGDNFGQWPDMMKAMRKEGAHELEDEMASLVGNVTGVPLGRDSQALRRFSSVVRTWTTLALMEKATFSSIVEPLTVGIRTGNVLDGIAAFRDTLKALRKTGDFATNRELAHDIGVIAGEAHAALMAQRFYAGDPTGRWQTQILAQYFRRTGLEQWTTASRVAAMRGGMVFMRRLARDLEAGGNKAKVAHYSLGELGITDPAAFGKWLRRFGDDLPDRAALAAAKGPEAAAYRAALLRFADQTIQRPTPGSRPKWARHPLGAMAFQLNAYSWAFGRSTFIRQANLLRAAKDGKLPAGAAAMQMAAGLMPALMGIAAGQYLFGEARDRLWSLLDDDPAHERMTEGFKVERALSRSSVLAGYDQFYQLIAGTRYNPSVAKQLLGPGIGSIVSSLDAVLQASFNNSDKTNSAERNLTMAAYDMLVEPTVNVALGSFGVNPITSGITVGLIPTLRPAVADVIAGKKKPSRQELKGLIERMLEDDAPRRR